MNTEKKLSNFFEKNISSIFEQTKKLPNYGQDNPAFLAIYKNSDTFNKITNILVNSNIGHFTLFAERNSHIIRFDDKYKITIRYVDSKENFDWAYDFYSFYSSVIFGKIFKNAGLKYSENGLEYIQYDLRPNFHKPIGSIVVTKKMSDILSILKLDEVEFRKGFESIEELFSFWLKTPYLNAKKIISPNKEHKLYILQRLEEYLILNNIDRENSEQLTYEHIKTLFPNIDFVKLEQELAEKAKRKNDIVNKFNGRVIMDTFPGFDVKKIGMSMSQFKQSFESLTHFNEFLTDHTKEEVMSKFKEVGFFNGSYYIGNKKYTILLEMEEGDVYNEFKFGLIGNESKSRPKKMEFISGEQLWSEIEKQIPSNVYEIFRIKQTQLETA